ncbi:hypothetical protein LHV03_02650 [Lactobacillus delbrueckii]|uniref:hypothetical protein n=1 Tax=Lactobacillus delbrueckii TaxID=1584 RepID=UPI000DEDDBDB|nr:hypothetical protein [Lactobacillus delbrueckii]MCH5408835.1 hypothetical protein [Lactobacillus delbrueckii]RCK09196.1 hypothetical protein DTW93_00565 [Lactobacillus delbrueckii subsp. bulgaricus]
MADETTTTATTETATAEATTDLKVTADQVELIQGLLADWTYGYRSDTEVSCKREAVLKDSVGKYPYAPEAPSSDLKDPVYDWVNNCWKDKSFDTISELTERAQQLEASKETLEKENASLVQMMILISSNIGKLTQALANLKTAQATQATNNTASSTASAGTTTTEAQ